MAGQKAQIKEAKNRRRDVGDRAGDRLQQQPATDHRARHWQDRSRPGTSRGQLGNDQQQLTGHQGGFAGWTNALELGQPEKFQQGQMHDHPEAEGEPPAPQPNDQQAKSRRRQTAQPTARAPHG